MHDDQAKNKIDPQRPIVKSEFHAVTLTDFLLTKWLDRSFILFGWHFQINRYYRGFPDTRRGFWIDRTGEWKDGEVEVCLHWCRIHRCPHSEKRWAKWRARFKEAPDA